MMANQVKRESKPPKAQTKLSDRTIDAWENSEAAKVLKKLRENPRVKLITVFAPEDACSACQQLVGTYPKDQVPQLPIEECSHPLGCRAFYAPVIDDVFP
jgi:hypothetical protein